MQEHEHLINELSALCGIVPEYWDIFGKKHVASLNTKVEILKAMGVNLESAEQIVGEISKRRWKSWRSLLDPVHTFSENDQPITIPVHIPVQEGEEKFLRIFWSIENDRGKKEENLLPGDETHISEEQYIDGVRYGKIIITDHKTRDIGYYWLTVECQHPRPVFESGGSSIKKKSKIIIAPDACYIPPKIQKSRAWGLSVNLYAICSGRNWGIGDFTDLKKIVKWLSGLKGSFVGINPLHAIPNTKPFGISPYSPLSRIYRNFIYLDLEKIPEFVKSKDIKRIVSSSKFRKYFDKVKNELHIDYEKIAQLKKQLLSHCFALFYKTHYLCNTSRGRDFKKYIARQGKSLEYFSLFTAIWEYMRKKKHAYIWQEWPEEYRSPEGPAVRSFRERKEKDVLFQQYLQWLIEGQLSAIAKEAKTQGMEIGIYHDLAIGSVAGGSDAWSFQDVFARGADVGAPVDDFSPDGQDWGFPPLIPEKLRETGYELFIQTIRKNMQHGGAIRIDHALGLFRLFWIPGGMLPKDGAYVNYPSDDLLRIIALESVRNKTLVVGEDLGTIGENVRESLQKFQMLSYRLFYFERDYPDPAFKAPENYPELALCAVTTHDLPTLYGYWKKRDLEVRKQLGKYPNSTLFKKQLKERERDKLLILAALKSQGIFGAETASIKEMNQELCQAIYHYLAHTPCKLLLVSIDDIIGTLDQQNMPGTIDTYPNWIQKMPLPLEKIKSDKRFIALSKMFSQNIR